jgi:hypothetical protein
MSVLLEYHSMQPVSSEVAAQIDNEQRQFLKTRCYWSEPLWVELEHAAPAKLVGGNSLFNSGGYETQSGKWMDVSEQEDYLMAWSDTDFIVHQLASWSRDHKIDWSVYSAGDHIGDVINGEPSRNLQDFVGGLLEASSLAPDLVPQIDQKFQNRSEPPPTTPQPSYSGSTASSEKRAWWRFW